MILSYRVIKYLLSKIEVNLKPIKNVLYTVLLISALLLSFSIGFMLAPDFSQHKNPQVQWNVHNKTGGDTLYDGSNPFLLVVTHPDWANYTSRFYVTEKMKMTISMQEQTPEETPNPEEYITIEDGTAYVLLVGLISAVIAAIIAVLLIKKRN